MWLAMVIKQLYAAVTPPRKAATQEPRIQEKLHELGNQNESTWASSSMY